MTARLGAKVSIGQVVPTTAALVAESVAALQAKLAGIIALQASIGLAPPTIAARITAAESLVAQLTANLAVSGPEININLSVMEAAAVDLNAQLAVLAALVIVFGTAGVYVFTHHGDEATYGGEMQAQVSAIAAIGNEVHSVTFLATDPAVFEALGKVLLTG